MKNSQTNLSSTILAILLSIFVYITLLLVLNYPILKMKPYLLDNFSKIMSDIIVTIYGCIIAIIIGYISLYFSYLVFPKQKHNIVFKSLTLMYGILMLIAYNQKDNSESLLFYTISTLLLVIFTLIGFFRASSKIRNKEIGKLKGNANTINDTMLTNRVYLDQVTINGNKDQLTPAEIAQLKQLQEKERRNNSNNNSNVKKEFTSSSKNDVKVEKKPYICGIYKIENSTNKKVYIGYSIDINKQCYLDVHKLRKGLHPNTVLQQEFARNDALSLPVVLNSIPLENSFEKTMEKLLSLKTYEYNNKINEGLNVFYVNEMKDIDMKELKAMYDTILTNIINNNM